MLDTNTLIDFVKSKPASVARRINALKDDDELCMSFVTWAELLKSAEGSVRKAEVLRGLAGLSLQVPVIYPTGPALCEHYARHGTRLQLAGRPIASNDLWIACHAMAEAASLVTNDLRESSRVEGLPLVNWVD